MKIGFIVRCKAMQTSATHVLPPHYTVRPATLHAHVLILTTHAPGFPPGKQVGFESENVMTTDT